MPLFRRKTTAEAKAAEASKKREATRSRWEEQTERMPPSTSKHPNLTGFRARRPAA